MKLTVLVENQSSSTNFDKRHGLSIYIETKSHKILFDLGPDDAFLKNAEKLNIDVKAIDSVIISHGHFDHGGGLESFLKINNTAKIYIHEEAFKEHVSKVLGIFNINIGLSSGLKNSNQIILIKDTVIIDDELIIFSNVSGKVLIPSTNKGLLTKDKDNYVKDIFTHEQNLIVKEDGKYYLFAGCAHKGIINIINKAEDILGKNINFTFGGFHLKAPAIGKSIHRNTIEELSLSLAQKSSIFYTCHCTGLKAFQLLKS